MLTRIMALRVLLADESSTIKKVFQLALQEFAVEVTAVAMGSDVLQVAEKVKPDILFADVLLQKKSGYDVCREIKNHPELRHIPVILIWSGFMELDQQKVSTCGADGHLEKPFDAKKLRAVVQEHVNKTKSNVLSDFLTLPKMPNFEEPGQHQQMPPLPQITATNITIPKPGQMPQPMNPSAPAAAAIPLPPVRTRGGLEIPPQPLYMPPTTEKAVPGGNQWSMDHFTPLGTNADASATTQDEFHPVALPSHPPKAPERRSLTQTQIEKSITTHTNEDAEWVNQSINRFRLPPDKTREKEVSVKFRVPDEKIDPETIVSKKIELPPIPDEETALELDLSMDDDGTYGGFRSSGSSTPPPTPRSTVAPAPSLSSSAAPVGQLNEQELEKIIRAQSQELIEKVVWQIVPEIATRVIERELERLLKERLERS